MTDPVEGAALAHLRKDAKRWLRAIRSGDQAALDRFRKWLPRHVGEPQLREVQQALARERGFVELGRPQDRRGGSSGRRARDRAVDGRVLASGVPLVRT